VGAVQAESVVHKKEIGTQSKVVLLEFWGTWSGRCRESIPFLNALQDKYSSRGFTVYAVSSEKPEVLTQFCSRNRINYPVASDKNLIKRFTVELIPMAYLIDRNGTVIWEGLPQQVPEDLIQKAVGGRAGLN